VAIVTVLFWLVPVVTVYAVGAGVGWVVRGFNRRKWK